ncbi:MAG: protein-disulfide reductase DsbD [Sulfurospirillaceae bacterium]|nr:protein-disulfide reductase DsbD [Sulfurospirillaceae bacterium]
MRFLYHFFLLFLFLLSSVFATTNQKILTPQEAFSVVVEQKEDAVILKFALGEKIYLYADKLKFDIIEPKKVSLDELIKRPNIKQIGSYSAIDSSFEILILNTLLSETVGTKKLTLQVSFQGCSEGGICYQPMKKTFALVLKNGKKTQSEQDDIADSFADESFLFVLLSFFGFGLLLSLTPCVFPMIPILSSIVVSQANEHMNTKRGFVLSLVYVFAMAVAYTIAGVLAGLFGANLQIAFQNPWIISIFSAIFVLLSLSMFGFYDIQMPNFIQSKLTKTSDHMQGRGIFGVSVMSFLSALIVGPCVAAPLAGALIYIGQSGDALLGGAALFMMSLGMGLPLVIIGTAAGKYMPRPGKWMENVKSVFGILMLGVAVWMISRVVDENISVLLWAVLILSSSVYLGAFDVLESESSWKRLFKSIALVMFVYAVALLVGLFSGSTNMLQPLERLTQKSVGNTAVTTKDKFQKVQTLAQLNEIIKSAKKPILLDFYASWCVSCVELEKNTFPADGVREKMNDFLLLKVDVTQNSDDDKAIMKEFGIFGPPAILFFKDQKELETLRVVGYKSPEEFLLILEKVF